MPLLFWILIFTFLGSFASLIGGVLLLGKEKLVKGKELILVAFAAGAMLAASFLDLIPEAVKEIGEISQIGQIGGAALLGVIVFFFLERFLLWHHHHGCLPAEAGAQAGPEGKECEAPTPTIPLLIIGDTLHNFLDGIVIAGAFLVSLPLGIITSLAVGFHEIPQEIGDFGVLLSLGMEKGRVIMVNIFSALISFLGAVLGFYFLENFEVMIPYLVAFAAGNFIYIAASDLIPQLHQVFERKTVFGQTLTFILGILTIFLAGQVFG